jgi:hypothetical protein
MEVIAKEKTTNSRGPTVQSSSFECESTAMDSLLGIRNNSHIKRRIDMPESRHRPACHSQIYAPLEVVQRDELSLDQVSRTKVISLHQDAEFKRDQLLRLLDQQQAWYDAQQQAARAAEQLLSLCEHHQQQWLQPNPQSLPASPVSQS